MLSGEERLELERCLGLYARGILLAGEVVNRLGAIARPHSLDDIVAELPPELIGPVRLQAGAYRPVRAVGYWCPSGFAPSRPGLRRPSDVAFPDPRRLVCRGPYPGDRRAIGGYLRAGRVYAQWCGLSYCRFRCGHGVAGASMGSRCQTDGAWVWPEGLPHYVEAHSVLLPEEFLRWVGEADRRISDDLPMPSYETQGQPDYEFWVAWGRSIMATID